jgi:hypothetical protein
MEVLVNPPTPQGAPAGGQAAPTTQVFFEGGTGFVTSALTGQTQEIGSGQNAIVDALGNVAAPEYTAPEQRSGMFQVWTSAQTMGSYSVAEGATGVGTNTKQEPLPQPPVGPMMLGVESLGTDFKKLLDSITDILISWRPEEPLVITIYDQTLPFISSDDVITGGSIALSAFDNHTWSAIISGTFTDYLESPEGASGIFGSGSDYLVFTATGVSEESYPELGKVYEWSGTASGSIGGITTPYIIIKEGPMSGTYTYTDISSPGYEKGTIEGAGHGTTETCGGTP